MNVMSKRSQTCVELLTACVFFGLFSLAARFVVHRAHAECPCTCLCWCSLFMLSWFALDVHVRRHWSHSVPEWHSFMSSNAFESVDSKNSQYLAVAETALHFFPIPIQIFSNPPRLRVFRWLGCTFFLACLSFCFCFVFFVGTAEEAASPVLCGQLIFHTTLEGSYHTATLCTVVALHAQTSLWLQWLRAC